MRCHAHTGGSVNRLLVMSKQAISKCATQMRKKREGERGKNGKSIYRRQMHWECYNGSVLVLQA